MGAPGYVVAALGVLATRHIAAERRRAAGLDRAHHLQLCVAHVSAVGVTPSGAEVAEDIGDLESRALHERTWLLRCVRGWGRWRATVQSSEER